MKNNVIKTVGSILKKEKLINVSNEFSKKYFVLKNIHPFPGYYEQTIPDEKILVPDSLFLITKENYSHEKIFRVSQKIKKCCDVNFDATPGTIEVFNVKKSCVRIHGFNNLELLVNLIEELTKYDIKIDKQGQVQEYSGLIELFKFFELKEIDDDEWLDLNNDKFSYFKLKKYIDWEEFEAITAKIKNNIENNLFDVAQGVLYINNSITDVVRIFSHNVDKKRIDKIKELFSQFVK